MRIFVVVASSSTDDPNFSSESIERVFAARSAAESHAEVRRASLKLASARREAARARALAEVPNGDLDPRFAAAFAAAWVTAEEDRAVLAGPYLWRVEEHAVEGLSS